MSEPTTHFGFETIPSSEKTGRVGAVFNSVASRYDLMNDLMSFGLQRFWKRLAISKAQIQSHHQVLDLAGGTGDLSALAAKQLSEGQVILADINNAMLSRGREKLVDQGVLNLVKYVQLNAETLPFPNDHFHCIIMGFGLRNVTHQDKALEEMFRVLKPGGRAIILEFSKTTSASLLGKLYDGYSFNVLPTLGKIVCDDADSYRYLAESIRKHPDQETLKSLMEAAGFEKVDYQNIHAGIVALHRGYKF